MPGRGGCHGQPTRLPSVGLGGARELREPLERVAQRLSSRPVREAVEAHAPLPASFHEPLLAQHSQRVGSCVLADVEGERDVSDTELLGGDERGENPRPYRLADHAQQLMELVGLLPAQSARARSGHAAGVNGMAVVSDRASFQDSVYPYGRTDTPAAHHVPDWKG